MILYIKPLIVKGPIISTVAVVNDSIVGRERLYCLFAEVVLGLRAVLVLINEESV